MKFTSFGENLRVIVVGASGGIGAAFVNALVDSPQVTHIQALSRKGEAHPSPKVASMRFDFTKEESLENAAQSLKSTPPYDMILVATGLLQGDGISPEKSMRMITAQGLAKSFEINTIGPAMTAKHLTPFLRRDEKAVYAALSALVGSISDNRLGGWYAYRAAKAALNMVIKTLAIEINRRFPKQCIIGLHPGTVDTDLSKPFQSNVPDGKLFTPEFSAESLLKIIDGIGPEDSGYLFDWAGERIPF